MKSLHKQDRLYVIVFDISDNSRRRKIVDLLEEQGIRVQKCVFEIVTSSTRIKHLAQMLEDLAGIDGNIRIYPMSKETSLQTITINAQPPITAGKSWVF